MHACMQLESINLQKEEKSTIINMSYLLTREKKEGTQNGVWPLTSLPLYRKF